MYACVFRLRFVCMYAPTVQMAYGEFGELVLNLRLFMVKWVFEI